MSESASNSGCTELLRKPAHSNGSILQYPFLNHIGAIFRDWAHSDATKFELYFSQWCLRLDIYFCFQILSLNEELFSVHCEIGFLLLFQVSLSEWKSLNIFSTEHCLPMLLISPVLYPSWTQIFRGVVLTAVFNINNTFVSIYRNSHFLPRITVLSIVPSFPVCPPVNLTYCIISKWRWFIFMQPLLIRHDSLPV